MTDPTSGPQKRARALIGVVAASALVYPLLVSAVELLLAQLVAVDVAAIVLWLAIALACSVALVAAVRWAAARRVRSAWLLLGLAPPVLYEVWLLWPLVAA
ncbi:MAG: hypothetical protein ACXVX8_17385 [Blastococcus sp.]